MRPDPPAARPAAGGGGATAARRAPRWGSPVPLLQSVRSALDLRPGLDPLGVVLADRPAIVAALLRRRRPVGDLAEVLLIAGVEDLAVILVRGLRTGLLVGGRLAEVLG